MENRQSISGRWDGRFTYPRTFQPEFFQASLLEISPDIRGTIVEKAPSSHAKSYFVSLVEGMRDDCRVEFSKIYDHGEKHHAVFYRGCLNAEGDEISGEWSISGHLSGQFLMVRRSGSVQRPGNYPFSVMI